MAVFALIGFLASALTTIAYIPQTVHTMKLKHTKGLSLSWLVMLISGQTLYAVYGALVHSIPIVASSIAGVIMGSIILYHKLKYK